MSDRLGVLEVALIVVIPLVAAGVYIKEEIAGMKVEIANIDERQERYEERNTQVMDKLSDNLQELSEVLAGVQVELRYSRQEKGEH